MSGQEQGRPDLALGQSSVAVALPRYRDGRMVVPRKVEDLKPGDLVQHYSTWDQTYGDPIRREVVKVEFSPDLREHKLVVTWHDPTDADASNDYQVRSDREKLVDLIVGLPTPVAPAALPFDGDFADASNWCFDNADDYGNPHAAMVDLLFPPGEDYDDVWLRKLWEVAEFVLAAPCTCLQILEEDPCKRCQLLNTQGHGR